MAPKSIWSPFWTNKSISTQNGFFLYIELSKLIISLINVNSSVQNVVIQGLVGQIVGDLNFELVSNLNPDWLEFRLSVGQIRL